MKIYQPLTLGDLIDKLKELDDAQVRGLDGKVHSYRGYYERNATKPCDLIFTASALAAWYQGEVGKDIYGWKGGDYSVRTTELIYYVDHGDTGPTICGFERGEDGVYDLVCVEESW